MKVYLAMVFTCLILFSSTYQELSNQKEVSLVPEQESLWNYYIQTGSNIYEIYNDEIILNGQNFGKINSTGFYSGDSKPLVSDTFTGCDVGTFKMNNTWFKLKGSRMLVFNGESWESRSNNTLRYVDNINCYHKNIRFDYEKSQVIIASFARSKGQHYYQEDCYMASFFSFFDMNGNHLKTDIAKYQDGYMHTQSNGACQTNDDPRLYSNKNIILMDNQSMYYGFDFRTDNGEEKTHYRLVNAQNGTTVYEFSNYINEGFRQGANVFKNETGEHLIFRENKNIWNSNSEIVVVTLHSNGSITTRTTQDPFPDSEDCIQSEISGSFGVPRYIQCENGVLVSIEENTFYTYSITSPLTILPIEFGNDKVALVGSSIFATDFDFDGLNFFEDNCPGTLLDEPVDEFGCSDGQYIDTWLTVELKYWKANLSTDWDNDGGLPDPYFIIKLYSDDTLLSRTESGIFENTAELNNSWKINIDVPNYLSSILVEIECRDKDAINDDECEMDAQDNEWILKSFFDFSNDSILFLGGDSTHDNDSSWREAISNWKISYLPFDEVDSDFDGVINRFDDCQGYDDSIDIDGDELPDGCDDFIDSDNDGIQDQEDECQGYDDKIDADLDGVADGCDEFIDSDGDGTQDADDLCPDTPKGAIVDWGCPMDTDEDGVFDGIDQCPNSVGYAGVDGVGCDLDLDYDGVPDFDDACPNTLSNINVNEVGCPMDSDSDGVYDGNDQCPNSVGDAGVDENGCDLDSDFDGTPDFDDFCPMTPLNANVDEIGCPLDKDFDGVFDGIDQCPNSIVLSGVDEYGCDLDSDSDGVIDYYDDCPLNPMGADGYENGCPNPASNSESVSSSTDTVTVVSCFVLFIVFVGIIVSKYRINETDKINIRNRISHTSVPTTQSKNSVNSNQNKILSELDNQRKIAQQQVVQLQQQLHQSNQMSAVQLVTVRAQMNQMQQRVQASENAKEELEKEFEQLKKESSTQISMQDSVVAGDMVVSGGTKIDSQTNQTIVGLGVNEIEKLLDRERANAIANARLEKEIERLKQNQSNYRDTKKGIEISGISEDAADIALYRSLLEDDD